jgi:hypothetical protein
MARIADLGPSGAFLKDWIGWVVVNEKLYGRFR